MDTENPDFETNEITQTCPSELRGTIPRKVRMSSTDASYLLGVVIVCLGLGSIAVGYECASTIHQMRQRTVLQQEGHTSVGKVRETRGGHGNSTVTYTFDVGKMTYVGNAEMPDYRLILRESDQIVIRYLPSDPRVNHPADWNSSALATIVPETFALFFTTMGAVALVVLLRDRKLAREGKPGQGVVIDCRPDKSEFRLFYEFRTEDGVAMNGSCNCPEECGNGGRVWILYLPNKPQRNHSYPTRYFSVVDSE